VEMHASLFFNCIKELWKKVENGQNKYIKKFERDTTHSTTEEKRWIVFFIFEESKLKVSFTIREGKIRFITCFVFKKGSKEPVKRPADYMTTNEPKKTTAFLPNLPCLNHKENVDDDNDDHEDDDEDFWDTSNAIEAPLEAYLSHENFHKFLQSLK
jgi:hypothetical protein